MNNMQKVAALYKAARLKKAAAAMLLVKRGCMQKRAEDEVSTEPKELTPSEWLDRALEVYYTKNKYVPILDANGVELFADEKDKIPLKELRCKQMEEIGRRYKQIPGHETAAYKLFDRRFYNPPRDFWGRVNPNTIRELNIEYDDRTSKLHPWSGRPRSEEEKQKYRELYAMYDASRANSTSWYQNPWILGGGALAGLGIAGLVYALNRRKKKKSSEKTAK